MSPNHRSFDPFEGEYDSFPDEVQCVCIGSGRFIRAVLVPLLLKIGIKCVIAQPRQISFYDYILKEKNHQYEVDEVLFDGSISTKSIPIFAAGTLSSPENIDRFMKLPSKMNIKIIGVGLTERALAKRGKHMGLLFQFLGSCEREKKQHVSIINTDNVVSNGNLISEIMRDFASDSTLPGASVEYIANCVTFHNSMVDCITFHRAGNPIIPLFESYPNKALCIEDSSKVLPSALKHLPCVFIRDTAEEIQIDHTLKIRVANGTHTALAHILALSGVSNTMNYSRVNGIMKFLEYLYENDIAPSCERDYKISRKSIDEVWNDWSGRLNRPNFGLSTFFITQNSFQKLGIRLVPSINSSLRCRTMPSIYMVVSVASLLYSITPTKVENRICVGKLNSIPEETEPFEYTAGLSVDLKERTYEFMTSKGSDLLFEAAVLEKLSIEEAIRKCLIIQGVLQDSPLFLPFSQKVHDMYMQLYAGTHLNQVMERIIYCDDSFVAFDNIPATVSNIVRETEVIDLHTHLLPPSHDELFLWGIDELLTYHYLVAEYFMTNTPYTYNEFFDFSVEKRADLIWEALFVNSSPISEASRGVITTLQMLGLTLEVRNRDLSSIREWFRKQSRDEYTERVFYQSGVKYCIMTNIPFSKEEAKFWNPVKRSFSHRFRSALRVDQLLTNDIVAIKEALQSSWLELTYGGLRMYLKKWVKNINPEYLMASTPHTFTFSEDNDKHRENSDSRYIDESSNLLQDVLLPFAEEMKLAIALKIGAHRGINCNLRSGGDGLITGQIESLRKLCSMYPKVKFLCTVLSKSEQHEIAVLANKMPNLHLYGCWWYCNNPSIIEDVTAMRLEMLGFNFTAQHSDARVLDQLLYKWSHSREIISTVLSRKYQDLAKTGWKLKETEMKRDIWRLLGGSYEDFMAKELA